MLNCLLDDLAFLFGLTCGRGSLDYSEKSLKINVPFKSIEAVGINKKYNQKDKLIIGLDYMVNLLGEFTGKHVRKISSGSAITISILFQSNTHTWQSLTAFFNGRDSFQNFMLPEDFFSAPRNLKLNFLRGFSDVAGFIRKSNYDRSKRYRVYLEIPNANWHLPIQICRLLQDPEIRVPVQTITWGHPNIRGKGNWAKEHQIKIYTEYFGKIGFTIDFKNEILEELANANISNFGFKQPSFCNPMNKKILKQRIYTDSVNSSNIHESIRGQHFNAFWQICTSLGCYKCKRQA
jgi:hypothetical protein